MPWYPIKKRGQAMPWYPIKKRGQAETGVRSICVASLLMLIRGGLEAPNIFYLSKVGSILYFRLGIPPALENCFLLAASLQSIVCSRHIARIAYIARALNWMIGPIGNWAIIETRSLAFANRNQKPKITIPFQTRSKSPEALPSKVMYTVLELGHLGQSWLDRVGSS